MFRFRMERGTAVAWMGRSGNECPRAHVCHRSMVSLYCTALFFLRPSNSFALVPEERLTEY